jgi:hypothetical protein
MPKSSCARPYASISGQSTDRIMRRTNTSNRKGGQFASFVTPYADDQTRVDAKHQFGDRKTYWLRSFLVPGRLLRKLNTAIAIWRRDAFPIFGSRGVWRVSELTEMNMGAVL